MRVQTITSHSPCPSFRSGAVPLKREAFTLIELLVVIAILSLLVSILLPSLQKAQKMAKTVMCVSNLRTCQMGVIMWTSENNGVYPYANPARKYHWLEKVYELTNGHKPEHGGYGAPYATPSYFGTRQTAGRSAIICPMDPDPKVEMQGTSVATWKAKCRSNYGYNISICGQYETPPQAWNPEPLRVELVKRPSARFAMMDFWYQPDDVNIKPTFLKSQNQWYGKWPDNIMRHFGGNNVVYLDGHAVLTSAEKIKQIDSEGHIP